MKERAAQLLSLDRGLGLAGVLVLALGPLAFSGYWVSFILTQVFWYAIVGMSMIFLSAYGGMVSLAQVPLLGIAGFTVGNVVLTAAAGNPRGLNLGWNPWLGVLLGIVIATAVGFVFGALASRSAGIYFLMITLTFAVIGYYFFAQVTAFSGPTGLSSIYTRAPALLGGNVQQHPDRLYYAALLVALGVYALILYIVRTPFGIALQGIRDEPVKMSSLGYNVALHRTLAFGFAAFLASLAGVLFVWWNGHIDPTSISLTPVLYLLIVAVIGGLYRLEGAWIGALAFVLIENYVRNVTVPLIGGTFNTVIGLIFLAIIVLSPGGLIGLWAFAKNRVLGQPGGGRRLQPVAAGLEPPTGQEGRG